VGRCLALDPPGVPEKNVTPVEFPADWIRRGNYGAWLTGMGYAESGSALRRGLEIALPERQLPVVQIGGHRYAVTLESLALKPHRKPIGHFQFPWFDPWFFMNDLLFGIPPRFLRELGVVGARN
jgi:hypothetical protein